jgi:hypothetical protein
MNNPRKNCVQQTRKGQFVKKLHLLKRHKTPSPGFGEVASEERAAPRKHRKQYSGGTTNV